MEYLLRGVATAPRTGAEELSADEAPSSDDTVWSIPIVYEDEHLMVVEKPSGLVVHPGYRHPDGTLWNLLTAHFAVQGDGIRPYLLHRLDRDTSGLLCVPKLTSCQ